jgi:hypothetical protein
MIHETKETIERLLDYAQFLVYEWGWKRHLGDHGDHIHRDEYNRLVGVIDRARKLLIRLEGIDGLGGKT